MRKKVSSIGVLLLIISYCFAVGFINPYQHAADEPTHASNNRDYFSGVKASLNDHASPSQSFAHNSANYTTPQFQFFLWGHTTFLQITEQLGESKFLHYSNLSRNFLVRNRKSDLLFPFHYFW